MRTLYNSVGASAGPKLGIYDVFTSLERNFGKERSPALLSQIKKFLREVHGATDADLDAAIDRRKGECLALLPEVLDSAKMNPTQFFRQLCSSRTGPILFCREVLIDSIREFSKTRPFVADDSELTAFFVKYCGLEGLYFFVLRAGC